MTPPVPPISSDQNQNSPTPPILPINAPPSEMEVLRQTVANMQGQIGQLVNTIQSAVSAQTPQAPPPPPALTAEDFQNNPQLLIDRINQDIARQVAPLNAANNQFVRANQYTAAKAQVKNANPMFQRFWSQIEPQLDATFASGQIEPHPQIIFYHVQALVGGLALQNPTMFATAPNMQQQPNNFIPPSGSPPPLPQNNAPPLRQLTDNERRIAKERGLSDADYLKLQEGNVMFVGQKPTGGR